MARRTVDQICDDLRAERSKLYSSRSRVNKKATQATNKRKKKVFENQYRRINKRIDKIRDELFRCGKKFQKLKLKKKSLKKHQSYRASAQKKIWENMGDLKLKIDNLKKLPKTRKNVSERRVFETELNVLKRKYDDNSKKARTTIKKINDLDQAMKLPISVLRNQKITGLTSTGGGTYKDEQVLWRLPDIYNSIISNGTIKILVLDGEYIDIYSNPILARMQIEQAYLTAMSYQSVGGTPKFFYYVDEINGLLQIFVNNYTTSAYDRFRH